MRGLCTLFFILQINTVRAVTIPITIEADIFNYAQIILADQSIDTVNDFHHPLCQRDVVEFVLLQKALKLGGMELKFKFELGNYDARNIKLLVDGLLLVSFDTLWYQEAQQHIERLYISDAIIRKGEYFAGLYTSAKSVSDIKHKIGEDLSQVSVISSQAWHTDWVTLSALNPKQLHEESDWIVMAKMVSRSWIDTMLVSFNNTIPFEYKGVDYRIVAIEGIKVPLQDSRHFVVSRLHPLGEATFNALQVGIKQLRASGFIEQSYKQCGFFNPHVEAWRPLTPK
ncbi:hypothetical protein [Pseudoalteromonas sp. MMG022]|uniref:hypothetical protein n=1 Tax=Pseudoalteromonas sp. MMG022 TaxID=2909978 RepID=UPI001F3FE369|nr:hypothetical protein [Pseudoalteromonas sp. MMG022]MCF6435677.1 hypothetical protein [Pseudoalteromonas sp. MMG022]